eukprot:TRINITY_DN3666_c0_g1_i2.p1 TRINITY_DN3666_c0_g1~~TRINITY_DN3666_c0_g1_i2.p1  ORF type:complete len:139 (-),score=5.86 TRINITY_DN3666_c0_g1_i2:40-456(-)
MSEGYTSRSGVPSRSRRRSSHESKNSSYSIKMPVNDKTPLVSPPSEEELFRETGASCNFCDLFCPVGAKKHCQLILFTSQMFFCTMLATLALAWGPHYVGFCTAIVLGLLASTGLASVLQFYYFFKAISLWFFQLTRI